MKLTMANLLLKIKIKLKFIFQYTRYIKYIESKRKINRIKADKLILLVSHDMSKSGAPLLLLHIAKRLSQLGWSIVTVSKRPGPLLKDFAVLGAVFVCDNPSNFRSSMDSLRENGVDRVLLNSAISGDWSVTLSKKGFKVISLVHELPGAIKAWGAVKFAEALAERSHAIVFPSTFVKKKFESLIDIKTVFKIYPQGLYLKSKIQFDKDQSHKVIQQIYKIDDRPIVLNVATGNFRKGFDLFIKMACLEPNYNFIWVGEIDSLLKSEAQQIIKSNKTKNLLIPGYINNVDTLMNLYAGSSVLALTSREEPFGSIVLESMSMGTPVVGFYDVGGFQDVVTNNKNGFLVEYENIELMLEKIRYINSSGLITKGFELSSRAAVQEYCFDNYVDRLLELFPS